MMELIVPFRKSDFTPEGDHIPTGKFIIELQQEWEEQFHITFNPYYANVIEGHPLVMYRLTRYFGQNDHEGLDFGMDLIDGKIDIDANLEIETFSETKTVYAIGSRLQLDEEGYGEPIFLVKNDKLNADILVLKYDDSDDEKGDDGRLVPDNDPVELVASKQ